MNPRVHCNKLLNFILFFLNHAIVKAAWDVGTARILKLRRVNQVIPMIWCEHHILT